MRQTHYANHHRRKDDTFAAGDLVYVSMVDLSLPKGRASKLLPKYVGPFKILDAQPSVLTYKVELPTQLRARNLHDCFHRSKLRPYYANNDALFPHCEVHMFYNFDMPDDQEWLVEEILSHQWDKNRLSFQILWNLGNTTWEPYMACKDLQALDDYLQLLRVTLPSELPRTSNLREC